MTLGGEARHWEVVADSGNAKDPCLLPGLRDAGLPALCRDAELIAVPAGSLDDLGCFKPHVLTYSVRRLAWDSINPSLKAFERMPTPGR